MKNTPSHDNTVASIIARIEAGGNFSTRDVLQYRREPNLIPALIEFTQGHPPEVRKAALQLLVDLGRPLVRAEGDLPDRLAPFMNEPAVVAYLVGALSDSDGEVRNRACAALVTEVPDLLVRNYSPEIIQSIRRYPTTDGAVLLLGKTGAEMAKTMLLTTDALHNANPDDTRMALARLGDYETEGAIIDLYRKAKSPEDKARYARSLGYMGTLRSVLTLARDIRTPETYVWRMSSRRSMRVHIIEGLHRAFLTEPVFWPPFFKPENDSYYEKIEDWLTRNLGVTWEQSRPPFLYEEDAPIIPGQGH